MLKKKLAVINIPRSAKVLLLEDSEERIDWFQRRIPSLALAKTAEAAINLIACSLPFDVVFLDYDLGITERSGGVVAKHLAHNYIGQNVVIHSWNCDGAAEMAACLTEAVVIPFGQFEINMTDV